MHARSGAEVGVGQISMRQAKILKLIKIFTLEEIKLFF